MTDPTTAADIARMEAEEPWPGYDTAKVSEIVAAVEQANDDDLPGRVWIYESSHKRRIRVLEWCGELSTWPGYDAAKVSAMYEHRMTLLMEAQRQVFADEIPSLADRKVRVHILVGSPTIEQTLIAVLHGLLQWRVEGDEMWISVGDDTIYFGAGLEYAGWRQGHYELDTDWGSIHILPPLAEENA